MSRYMPEMMPILQHLASMWQVPEKIQGSLTVAAFALLFGLMLFATYNDIVRLVTGAV